MKGDTQEKTEQPSAKRLRDARKKGSVAKSRDLVAACTFAVLLIMMGLLHELFFNRLRDMFMAMGDNFHLPLKESIGYAAAVAVENILWIILPLFAVAVGVVIVVHIVQFGFVASFEPVTPQFDKINPVEGFKRLFSLDTFVEAVKSILKIVLLGLILFFVIKDALEYLVHLPEWGLAGLTRAWLILSIKISAVTAIVFLIIGLLDVFMQKHLYRRKHKMSKDEVKREYKDLEGDPLIKGMRKSIHYMMLSEQTAHRAQKATVVITNPVHFAVALYYKRRETGLPVVVTKGEHYGARKIIKIAEKANVPVIRNVSVARALYFQVEIGDYIPRDLIEPVAEIIRWVLMNSPHEMERR